MVESTQRFRFIIVESVGSDKIQMIDGRVNCFGVFCRSSFHQRRLHLHRQQGVIWVFHNYFLAQGGAALVEAGADAGEDAATGAALPDTDL